MNKDSFFSVWCFSCFFSSFYFLFFRQIKAKRTSAALCDFGGRHRAATRLALEKKKEKTQGRLPALDFLLLRISLTIHHVGFLRFKLSARGRPKGHVTARCWAAAPRESRLRLGNNRLRYAVCWLAADSGLQSSGCSQTWESVPLGYPTPPPTLTLPRSCQSQGPTLVVRSSRVGRQKKIWTGTDRKTAFFCFVLFFLYILYNTTFLFVDETVASLSSALDSYCKHWDSHWFYKKNKQKKKFKKRTKKAERDASCVFVFVFFPVRAGVDSHSWDCTCGRDLYTCNAPLSQSRSGGLGGGS